MTSLLRVYVSKPILWTKSRRIITWKVKCHLTLIPQNILQIDVVKLQQKLITNMFSQHNNMYFWLLISTSISLSQPPLIRNASDHEVMFINPGNASDIVTDVPPFCLINFILMAYLILSYQLFTSFIYICLYSINSKLILARASGNFLISPTFSLW